MPDASHPVDDIAAWIAGQPAFSALASHAQAKLAGQWQVDRMAEGDMLLAQGALHTRLGMVISGAVDLHDPDLERAVRLAPGALFGFGATPARHLPTWQATAAADGAVATIDGEDRDALFLELARDARQIFKRLGDLELAFFAEDVPEELSSPGISLV